MPVLSCVFNSWSCATARVNSLPEWKLQKCEGHAGGNDWRCHSKTVVGRVVLLPPFPGRSNTKTTWKSSAHKFFIPQTLWQTAVENGAIQLNASSSETLMLFAGFISFSIFVLTLFSIPNIEGEAQQKSFPGHLCSYEMYITY